MKVNSPYYSLCRIRKKAVTQEKSYATAKGRSGSVSNTLVVGVEEQRYAPDTRESNYYIDYSRKNACSAACYPRNEVEGKQPNESPVKTTDYSNNQRDFIYYHHNLKTLPFRTMH